MVFIFLIILLLLLAINLLIIKDIFHPTAIFKIVWIISVTVLLFYQKKWGVTLSFKTICIFISGFLAFDLGFALFTLFKKDLKPSKKVNNNITQLKNVYQLKNNRLLTILLIVGFISSFLISDIVKVIGGVTNLFTLDFFLDYRSVQYDGLGTTNNQQFLFRVLEVIGLSSLIFMLRERDKSGKRVFVYVLILLITFGIQILTTGRMRFLAIIVQASLIYLFNARKQGLFLSFNNQKRFVIKLFRIAIAFLVLFYLYGKYAVNKISEVDPFNSIAIYVASGLPAFDMVWPIHSNTSEFFGQSVLAPFYNLLSKFFGLEFGTDSARITKSFVKGENGFSTNVYTIFHEQIQDFGVWFVPFVMMFIGILLAFLKYKSDQELIIGFWSALYSLYLFSIIISFFQDTIFVNSTFTYITIFCYFIIFKTEVINKNTIKRENYKSSKDSFATQIN